jgi:hypothetical protein
MKVSGSKELGFSMHCCGDDDHGHGHNPSSGLSAQRAGEVAAERDAARIVVRLQRLYRFDSPSDPGVCMVVQNRLREHAEQLAAKMGGSDTARGDFVDGFMSAAMTHVFRRPSALQRSSPSGAVTRSTGVVMAGVGVAILAGAGVAHWWLKKHPS